MDLIYQNASELQSKKKGNSRKMTEISQMYPHGESNANRRNRNPKFYPLNYGGGIVLQIYKNNRGFLIIRPF